MAIYLKQCGSGLLLGPTSILSIIIDISLRQASSYYCSLKCIAMTDSTECLGSGRPLPGPLVKEEPAQQTAPAASQDSFATVTDARSPETAAILASLRRQFSESPRMQPFDAGGPRRVLSFEEEATQVEQSQQSAPAAVSKASPVPEAAKASQHQTAALPTASPVPETPMASQHQAAALPKASPVPETPMASQHQAAALPKASPVPEAPMASQHQAAALPEASPVPEAPRASQHQAAALPEASSMAKTSQAHVPEVPKASQPQLHQATGVLTTPNKGITGPAARKGKSPAQSTPPKATSPSGPATAHQVLTPPKAANPAPPPKKVKSPSQASPPKATSPPGKSMTTSPKAKSPGKDATIQALLQRQTTQVLAAEQEKLEGQASEVPTSSKAAASTPTIYLIEKVHDDDVDADSGPEFTTEDGKKKTKKELTPDQRAHKASWMRMSRSLRSISFVFCNDVFSSVDQLEMAL